MMRLLHYVLCLFFSLLWNLVGSDRAVVLPKMRVAREDCPSGTLHTFFTFLPAFLTIH